MYEMAEIAQLFTGVSQWWLGLSDFNHEGNWKWVQSNTDADLSLYSDFFSPNTDQQNKDDCAIMRIVDRELEWKDINCMDTSFNGDVIVPICQCKGSDCPSQPTTIASTTLASTTLAIECSDNWIDAEGLGCIQFMPDLAGSSFSEAREICQQNNGFLVETTSSSTVDFVSTLANVIHSYTPDVNSWWIGLFKIGVDWIWLVSSELAQDTNWEIGEPKDGNSCATLSRNSNGEYKWVSVPCDESMFDGLGIAPICQECRPQDGNCGAQTTSSVTASTGTSVSGNTTASITTTGSTTSIGSTIPPITRPPNCEANNDLGTCYLHSTSKASWFEAEAACEQLGGHLASSLSEVENSFMGTTIVQFENVWIGGSKTGDSWSWSDQSTWDFTNWKAGEPKIGTCSYFNWQSFSWSSYDCTFSLKYVCKFV